MTTPPGSPSCAKSFSAESPPRRSRKRTLDQIEIRPLSRAQRKMEAAPNSTPPRSNQTSETNPTTPHTVRKEPTRSPFQSSQQNGEEQGQSSPPTNDLRNGGDSVEDYLSEVPEPGAAIEHFDWSDLEQRFDAAMEERLHVERGIQHDFQKLTELFEIWAKTSSEHVNKRAYKRLRTLTTSVRFSEEKLEDKRNHYVNVVKAFQSALDLLKDP